MFGLAEFLIPAGILQPDVSIEIVQWYVMIENMIGPHRLTEIWVNHLLLFGVQAIDRSCLSDGLVDRCKTAYIYYSLEDNHWDKH